MTYVEKRNVLVITLGGAPGVVTETVYALLKRTPPWVPQEIYLVTTSFGAKTWRDPESRPNRELAALFRHFGCAPIAPFLLVPETEDRVPIDDIRTEEENIAFANALTWHVMAIKERPNTRLHVSMAGGRKTMSSYSQAAVSYFAEEHDELTHILVDPPTLEYSSDFFWPCQEQQDIDVSKRPPPPPPETVKASSANIAMVPSPFLRLRDHMKRIPFARNNFDHWTLTERVQAKLDAYAAGITLRVAERILTVGGGQLQFGNQEFALYRVLAAAILESWPGTGPEGQGDNHVGWILIADFLDSRSKAFTKFFEFYRDCFDGDPDEPYHRFKNDIDRNLASGTAEGRDYVANRFKTLRNKIKERVLESVPSYAARRRVTPVSESAEPRGNKYGLPLEPYEIEIVPRGAVGLPRPQPAEG
jgi:CRISPR-associated protein (TIGR02584 family)